MNRRLPCPWPEEIHEYAKAGKWNEFKAKIETHSRRVADFLSDTVPKMSAKDVDAAERAHDALIPAFKETIAKAERQVIDRLATNDGEGEGDAAAAKKKRKLRVRTVPVPVVLADDFSVERFVTEHAIPGKPVVIRGLNMTSRGPWTLEHFARVCGDVKVQLNTKSANTTNWGGLVVAGNMPLNEFAREYARNETLRTWYLHDWSLNHNCPDAVSYTHLTLPTILLV